jgi:hypothetical protein
MVWSLALLGASHLWALIWRRSFSLNFLELCHHLVFGLSLQALISLVALYTGCYQPEAAIGFMCIFACSGGVAVLKHGAFPKIKDSAVMYLIVLFIVIAMANLVRQFSIPSGQEAFQYHYFIPRLYNEQLNLFLEGQQILRVKNFWGFEVLFILGDALGGWALMQIQTFGYLILISLLGISFLRMYGCSSFYSLVGGILILTTPFYLEYTWYVKPTPLLSGITVYLCGRLIHQKKFDWFEIAQLSLIAWLCIQIKITSVLVVPVLFILLFRSGFSAPKKLAGLGLVLLLLLPWRHLQTHYLEVPSKPSWEVEPNYLPLSLQPGSTSPPLRSPNAPSSINAAFDFLQQFKPWNILFLLAFPLAFCSGFKISILIFYSLSLGIYFHEKSTYPAFGDAFRYSSLLYFLIPLTIAHTLNLTPLKKKWIVLCVCLGLTIMVYRRSVTTLDSIKYHLGYMKGQQTFEMTAKHLGTGLLKSYETMRNKGDRLLYLGQANAAIRHSSVFSVDPWSPHLRWEKLDLERFLNFCHNNQIEYILYDQHKYSVYARGYGGTHNTQSPATHYYRQAVEILSKLNPWVIEGFGGPIKLIKLPERNSLLKIKKTGSFRPEISPSSSMIIVDNGTSEN